MVSPFVLTSSESYCPGTRCGVMSLHVASRALTHTSFWDVAADIVPSWSTQISRICHKILPLVTIEDSLASKLSAGITVAASRSGVFIRDGWQSIVTLISSWAAYYFRSGPCQTGMSLTVTQSKLWMLPSLAGHAFGMSTTLV